MKKNILIGLLIVAPFITLGQNYSKRHFYDSIKTEQQLVWKAEQNRRKLELRSFAWSKEDSLEEINRKQAFLRERRWIKHQKDSLKRVSIDSLISLKSYATDKIDLSNALFDTMPEFCRDIDSVILSGNEIKELKIDSDAEMRTSYLNVGNNKIASIVWQKNKTLAFLNLSENELSAFPRKVKKLKNLQVLDVSDNDFGAKKIRFGKMKKLEQLDLSNTHLSRLPESLRKLKNLKSLKISNNQLTSLKGIEKLHQLEVLVVSQNIVALDPREICQLTQLKKLTMNKCWLIYIPPEIAQLQNLEQLTLAENKIRSVPEDVKSLQQLKNIILYKNSIEKLPEGLYQLKSLEELDVYYNQVKRIGSEIGQLRNLKKLFLSHNELIEIPDEINQLTQLEELYLHHNKLSYLPDLSSMSKLKYLHAQNNVLVEFPASIFQIENLRELDLSDNLISDIPLNINQLTQLNLLSIVNVGLDADRTKLTILYHSLKELEDAGVNVKSNFERVEK